MHSLVLYFSSISFKPVNRLLVLFSEESMIYVYPHNYQLPCTLFLFVAHALCLEPFLLPLWSIYFRSFLSGTLLIANFYSAYLKMSYFVLISEIDFFSILSILFYCPFFAEKSDISLTLSLRIFFSICILLKCSLCLWYLAYHYCVLKYIVLWISRLPTVRDWFLSSVM